MNFIVFDEADEIFNQEGNSQSLQLLTDRCKTDCLKAPQFVLFSATIDENTLKNIATYINSPPPTVFTVSKEAIKLQNVKQLKMSANEQTKRQFLNRFYDGLSIPNSQAMIFVNTKKTAGFLEELLTKLGKTVKTLTSDIPDYERDAMIDDFRR